MDPGLCRPNDNSLTSGVPASASPRARRASFAAKGDHNKRTAMGVGAAVVVMVVVGVVVVAGGTGVEALTPPEIKTLFLPPVDQTEEPVTYKDCLVYHLQVLQSIKRHGETWDNDEASDCEQCICLDGDVRCFYHFCNDGLSVEYATPPSAESAFTKVPVPGTGDVVPPDDESDEEESSGVDPDDVANPFLSKLSKNKSPKEPGWEGQRADLDLGEERRAGEKDPWDNETYDDRHDDLYDLQRHQLCQDSCKKTCTHGFKVDAKVGCSKCKCFKCHPLDNCSLKCPHGFAHDHRLCPTCKCRHIHFADTLLESDLVDKYKPTKEEEDEKQEKDDDEITKPGTTLEGDLIVDETSAAGPTQGPSKSQRTQEELELKEEEEDAGGAKGYSEVDPADPLCDLTKRPGCMEGAQLYSVGAVWTPSPCVVCRCVTPDYKECNVTQCAPLTCQPHRQLIPPQTCCPICADPPRTQAHEQYRNDSHSSSHVPEDLVLTRPHKAHKSKAASSRHGHSERVKGVPAGNGTLRSALPGSSEFWWWQLFVPMVVVAVVASIVTAVVVVVWRRYHRDKYYITAGRPDETERLRPVPVRTVENGRLMKQV